MLRLEAIEIRCGEEEGGGGGGKEEGKEETRGTKRHENRKKKRVKLELRLRHRPVAACLVPSLKLLQAARSQWLKIQGMLQYGR
jgi:hypothetical protein